MTMDIAIDLDGTLAETHEYVFDRAEGIEYSNFKQQDNGWGEEDWEEYNHWSSNAWNNHMDEIDMIEPSVVDALDRVAEYNHVTILTHRTNADEQIQAWLKNNDISYHEFVSTHKDKREYDMDLYVDDSVVVPQEAVDEHWQFLYDRPYNKHVDHLERISSLYDLLIFTPQNMPTQFGH